MNFINIKGILIVETVLYLSFLSLDIVGFSFVSAYIKFLSIVILFLFVLIKSVQTKMSFVIPMALGFSVFADYFLLFSSNYIPGLCAFLIVQIFLFYHIYYLFKLSFWKQVRLPLFLFFVGGIGAVRYHFLMDSVAFIAMFYFLFFFSNVVTICYQLYQRKIKSKKQALFSFGCVLFFLCDLHVGLYNISDYYAIRVIFEGQKEWFFLAMWLFYLPGQTLIGISNFAKENCLQDY